MSDVPSGWVPAATRHLCVVLHDVAPAHWSGCMRVLHELRTLADDVGVALPVTLLVVPRPHGPDAGSDHPYLRWLRRLAREGHELVLHGLAQRDAHPAHGPHEPLRWRDDVATGDAEALDPAAAHDRLARGRAWARAHGLEMAGFVAPAWLLDPSSRPTVAPDGFDYTCTATRVIALPGGQAQAAPALVFRTRAAWRRALSLTWNHLLAMSARQASLLRLELHPHDCDHAAVMRCWSRLLAEALRTRQPLRLGEAAELVRRAGANAETECA